MSAGPGPSLETVVIFTTAPDALVAFYRDGLGLPEPERPHPGHAGWRIGPVYLGIDAVEAVGGTPPGGVRCWFTVDDLEGTVERFRALGAPVLREPCDVPWGARLARVADPDGNEVGLSLRR